MAGSPTFLDILVRKDAWGTFLGNASYTYAYYFLLTWLPSYLVNERHVSLREMGVLGSIPFLVRLFPRSPVDGFRTAGFGAVVRPRL